MATISKKASRVDTAISGYEFEGARAKAVADIKRAIVDEKQERKQVELRFIGGLIAKRMFLDLPRKDALARGIGLAGATSPGRTPKAGQAVRSPEENTVWDSCRKQWHRCAKDAGIVKPRKPSEKPRKSSKKPNGGKPGVKLVAKPKDAHAANLMLLNMAQMASGFCAKYKDTVSDEAKHATANYLAAMAKLAK